MTFVLPNMVFVHVPKTGGSSIKRVLSSVGQSSIFGYHDTASVLRTRITWEQHFSFAFVRNPWARAVSMFLMADSSPHRWCPRQSFVNFLSDPPGPDMWGIYYRYTQSSYVSEGDGLLIDFLGRFETLQQDWRKIAEMHDLPTELPHLNASQPIDYHDCYDEETKQIVARDHAEDIERFEYRF